MASHAQDNLDRAVAGSYNTLHALHTTERFMLDEVSTSTLRAMAWDLEAIAAVLRMELSARETQHPIDLG